VTDLFATDLNLHIIGCVLTGIQRTCTNNQSGFVDTKPSR
jgi:hypothetical protein